MPRRRWLVGCSVLAATMSWGVSSAAADDVRKPAEQGSQDTATADASSQQASKKDIAAKRRAAKKASFLLHGVRWYRGLDSAQAATQPDTTSKRRRARSKRNAGAKPILWLRVLGDPTGNT